MATHIFRLSVTMKYILHPNLGLSTQIQADTLSLMDRKSMSHTKVNLPSVDVRDVPWRDVLSMNSVCKNNNSKMWFAMHNSFCLFVCLGTDSKHWWKTLFSMNSPVDLKNSVRTTITWGRFEVAFIPYVIVSLPSFYDITWLWRPKIIKISKNSFSVLGLITKQVGIYITGFEL